MIETVRSVHENYEHHNTKIFNYPGLLKTLQRMKKDNNDNIGIAVRTMTGKKRRRLKIIGLIRIRRLIALSLKKAPQLL
jgi:predicted acetyltransferase